jgi:hypothetical protein
MANRWAPWIEAVVVAGAGAQVFNGGAAIALIGAQTVTVTPKTATRLLVTASVDYQFGIAGGGFVARLYVNGGVVMPPEILVIPTTIGVRALATQVWTVDVAAGAATTVEIRALAGGASQYQVQLDNCCLAVIGLPSDGISY